MTSNAKPQRELFEAAVIDRMKESGFLEIEIRTECLVRLEDGYQDEVINAGWHYWQTALSAQPPAETTMDPALIGIAEEMKESGGHWQPCSGCYDTEDGHPTAKYPFSQALQSPVGSGCHECGGLGALWWHMTDEEVANFAKICEEIDAEHELEIRIVRLEYALRFLAKTYAAANGEDHPAYNQALQILTSANNPAPTTFRPATPYMTDGEVQNWIDTCNHEPAREALRHYLALRSALTGQVKDDDIDAAINLGAAVLSKIVDPAARETAIRNALIAASKQGEAE